MRVNQSEVRAWNFEDRLRLTASHTNGRYGEDSDKEVSLKVEEGWVFDAEEFLPALAKAIAEAMDFLGIREDS